MEHTPGPPGAGLGRSGRVATSLRQKSFAPANNSGDAGHLMNDDCLPVYWPPWSGVSGESRRRRRFDALFDAYRLDIASYCSWRTGSRADAEDAAAETFLVAWRKFDAIPPGAAARAWLYATARRVTANERRSQRRRDALADRLSRESFVGPMDAIPTSPEEVAVHEALARLNEHDREVLLLVEWEGLRPSELGRVLGCAEVTARGRLHRARTRFREEFQTVLEQQADFASDQGLVTPGTFKPTKRKAQA